MTDDEVRLILPAAPEYLRLARITASGLASRLGFSYDEVDDLRLALDELCFALVGADGRAGTLELRYMTPGEAIEIEGVLHDGGASEAPALSDLARLILQALVDDHAVREDGDHRPVVWLRKARVGTTRP
ncbi:MAG: ATP-binding protein [Acidimicrobiales bacterium]